mmetsp:Transcript_21317/g.63705  ORF Transcript_21317/g.63705 Transcript_21317/m.63705 type:complete len:186 (+) Transcript_21317:356-913(+)
MFRKVLQSAIFNVASNAIAQRIRRRVIGTKGVLHALVWGIVRGVLTVLWYAQLSKFWPGREPLDVAGKVIVDQLLYTPVNVTCRFFVLALLDGRGLGGGLSDTKAKLVDVLLVGWKIWPAIHAANFYFVPDAYQILTVWTASLVYSTLVELSTLRDAKPTRKKAAAPMPTRRNPPRQARSPTKQS